MQGFQIAHFFRQTVGLELEGVEFLVAYIRLRASQSGNADNEPYGENFDKMCAIFPMEWHIHQ